MTTGSTYQKLVGDTQQETKAGQDLAWFLDHLCTPAYPGSSEKLQIRTYVRSGHAWSHGTLPNGLTSQANSASVPLIAKYQLLTESAVHTKPKDRSDNTWLETRKLSANRFWLDAKLAYWYPANTERKRKHVLYTVLANTIRFAFCFITFAVRSYFCFCHRLFVHIWFIRGRRKENKLRS